MSCLASRSESASALRYYVKWLGSVARGEPTSSLRQHGFQEVVIAVDLWLAGVGPKTGEVYGGEDRKGIAGAH